MIPESSREALALLGFDTDLAWRGGIVRARFDDLEVSLADWGGGFALVASGSTQRTMLNPYEQLLPYKFDEIALGDMIYERYRDLYGPLKEPPQELVAAKHRFEGRISR